MVHEVGHQFGLDHDDKRRKKGAEKRVRAEKRVIADIT
jgi:hypothetical protein